MPVTLCGRRYRGDCKGIISMMLMLTCWGYSTYCTLFVLVKLFMDGMIRDYFFYGYIALSSFTILSFLHGIVSDPGKVEPVSRATANAFNWDYCEKCSKHRPPRSHHCTRCGRCIKKMDHHCIWMNNCVGDDNLGLFTRLIFYASAQCAASAILCMVYYINFLPTCQDCPFIPEEEVFSVKVEIFSLLLISVALCLSLSTLTIKRVLLIMADVTIIEIMQDRSILAKKLQSGERPKFSRELSYICGTEYFILWFIPCVAFKVIPSHERPASGPLQFDV